jgi:hypothetical protein
VNEKTHCFSPSVKHDQVVHQSEVRANGLQILKDVYFTVLDSKDKELWKKAIASMHRHVAELEVRVKKAAADDAPDANFLVTELWAWNSARRQLCARFGRRFIRSPRSHAQTADEPL